MPIGDTRIFDETGVVVVAVMRHGEPIPINDGNFRLRAGDTAIVVGAPDCIDRAGELLKIGALQLKLTAHSVCKFQRFSKPREQFVVSP